MAPSSLSPRPYRIAPSSVGSIDSTTPLLQHKATSLRAYNGATSSIGEWAKETAKHTPASSYGYAVAPSSVASSKKSGKAQSVNFFEASQTSSKTSAAPQPRIQVAEFSAAYSKLNGDINAAMGKTRSNAARILTGAGTFATVGGAVAMALAAPAALTGLLTGVGVPHGAAVAILAVGVGLAGLAISVVAGALVRSLTRKSLKKRPEFADKIVTLKKIEASLVARSEVARLDNGDAALLRNTRALLRKVDGRVSTSLAKQAGNALAAPMHFFSGLAGMFRSPKFDAEGNAVVPMKKKFVGNQFFASLGVVQPRSEDDKTELSPQLQSEAGMWLDRLWMPAVSLHD